MSDNNGSKIAELGLFLESNGIGFGWGVHYEDRRWENEVRLYIRTPSGIKDFLFPKAMSMWKEKEIAHETFYGWGLLGVYVDIPSVKTKSDLLSQ